MCNILGRGAKNQIAIICWIKENQRNSRKTSASLTTLKPLTVWITTNYEKFFKRWEYQTGSLPTQKVLQYLWECLWTCCAQCGSAQIQTLPYFSLHLLPKSTSVPTLQSLRLIVGISSVAPVVAGANYPPLLWLQRSVPLWFCPTSACRSPSGVCCPPRQEGA